MQLKLQRSQRHGGLTASTIFFCLDVRADYTQEERSNINRYKLGGQTIYNSRTAQKHLENAGVHLDKTQEGTTGSRMIGLAGGAYSMALAKMQLNISIASLGRGHHIECKDLEELLESEETIRNACKNLTRYLEIADTFDGSEVVVEYVNGEERVHVTQNAPSLIEYQPDIPDAPPEPAPVEKAMEQMGKDFGRIGAMFKNRYLTFETKLIAFMGSKGWNVGELQVRAVCGVAALIAFIVFLQIL